MIFLLSLLFFLLPAQADLITLKNQKAALQQELNLVRNSPGVYYLVVDLNAKKAYLKADANLLRTCNITQSFGIASSQTQSLRLVNHILPYTPEPKTIRRQRELPLDFTKRLNKGPKNRSQIYFLPSFVIQSHKEPVPTNISGILLNPADTKAIASALPLQSTAIVIPTTPNANGTPK